MKTLYIAAILSILAASYTSCSTPEGTITGRPDPNTSTSGTLGSVKATNGVLPLNTNPLPDTSRVRH